MKSASLKKPRKTQDNHSVYMEGHGIYISENVVVGNKGKSYTLHVSKVGFYVPGIADGEVPAVRYLDLHIPLSREIYEVWEKELSSKKPGILRLEGRVAISAKRAPSD